MLDFGKFVTGLQEQLRLPLPGLAAQMRMAPATRQLELYKIVVDTPARKSAVLALFYPDGETTRLLLIKRAVDRTVHSGQVSFPGGKYEEKDGSLERTALREACEETGIRPEAVKIIGKLSTMYIPPSNFMVFPFIGYLDEKPSLKANEEVQRLLEVDFEELRRPETRVEKTIFHPSGKSVTVPCYFVENEIVWGATAMMLAELLEVAAGIPTQ